MYAILALFPPKMQIFTPDKNQTLNMSRDTLDQRRHFPQTNISTEPNLRYERMWNSLLSTPDTLALSHNSGRHVDKYINQHLSIHSRKSFGNCKKTNKKYSIYGLCFVAVEIEVEGIYIV